MPKTKHGYSRSPTYNTWRSMLSRCHNPDHDNYPRYGAKGIHVCLRWRKSFQKFLLDMGKRPEGTTLDRIRRNRGYTKSNCRWATKDQQYRNRKNNVWVTLNNQRMIVSDACRQLGLKRRGRDEWAKHLGILRKGG